MAIAIEIRRTSQSPTSRKSGAKRAADQNVVIQIPDRCLPCAGITEHPVRVAVAVKVSYCSRTCRDARRRSGSGRRRRCRRRVRNRDRASHIAARPMWSAVIRKRPDTVEGVREGSALVENPRVPDSIGHPGGTRGGAVSSRAPSPLHCIARVNRHG